MENSILKTLNNNFKKKLLASMESSKDDMNKLMGEYIAELYKFQSPSVFMNMDRSIIVNISTWYNMLTCNNEIK